MPFIATKRAFLMSMFVATALFCGERSAYAHNYVGSWSVFSPSAVDTLESSGFNLFLVPANVLSDSEFDATLAAINPDHFAIVSLDSSDETHSRNIIAHVQSSPDYAKVLAYFSFDEPNLGNGIPVETQRNWYAGIKALDPSKSVIISVKVDPTVPDFRLTPQFVDQNPGQSWDVIMVDAYPWLWGVSDSQGLANIQASAAAVANYFNPSAWIIPIQQAAYSPTQIVPELRPYYDLSQEYGAWWSHGVPNNSHALFYYSWWAPPPETGSLSSDSTMLDSARTMANQHKSIFP